MCFDPNNLSCHLYHTKNPQIAATAAYWILFRLLALYPRMEALRFVSACVAALAVNGMHYTGEIMPT